mmetsp:Transcript_10562/g.23387  ORF Transcript_10562/g.23387 Transcript_10562/m.23387 type:complete len:365 (+) Transcript_10562:133-1227(+)|eukprot:CAMPEP_0172311046 /NCGR_PEP_ID=MMETSP1058-20130122/13650_1 /TAXON_ID=83371 /ORGANISM="Detonula confervacea, Strain CCMP 353" /LENGTH=364 /DNA_ID=CAMNT_0013024103 /DNA_START=70 /DNA_END=1164 /DNA_ORIENTATION=-
MITTTKQPASLEWRRHILVATFALSAWMTNNAPSLHAHAFSHPGILPTSIKQRTRPVTSRLYVDTDDQPSASDSESSLPSPNDMRLREIQSELKEKNISYADCFDKESLVKRLIEARDGLVAPSPSPPKTVIDVATEQKTKSEKTPPSAEEPASKNTAPVDVAETTTESEEFDKESTLIELRSLRVKELKERLSGFKVRWGTMIEKEEMVQALCKAMEERFELSKNFSRSGSLIPGTVVDVEESTLIKELGWLESDVNRGVATQAADGTSSHSPILLDVYATWCGPCQFLAPLLVQAAEELGPTVRVVKLDSDKYPRISSLLKVGGLPTLIRFDGGDVSKEVQRVEGALTKDQIIDFVNGDFKR